MLIVLVVQPNSTCAHTGQLCLSIPAQFCVCVCLCVCVCVCETMLPTAPLLHRGMYLIAGGGV